MRAVSLYSGCGGFDEGVELAGFSVELAVEIDAAARQTHSANFPGIPVLPSDVRGFLGHRAARQREIYRLSDIDLVFGGPPCQGFSRIGCRDPDDRRNLLCGEFVRVVTDLRPRALLLENVPDILLASGGRFADDLLAGFQALGYANAAWMKVIATDFGVPQFRERVVFVATRDGCGGPPHIAAFADGFLDALRVERPPTVGEAIGDLPAGVVASGRDMAYPVPVSERPRYQRMMRLGESEEPFTAAAKARRACGQGQPRLHNHHTKEIGPRRACRASTTAGCSNPQSVRCSARSATPCRRRWPMLSGCLRGSLFPSPAAVHRVHRVQPPKAAEACLRRATATVIRRIK